MFLCYLMALLFKKFIKFFQIILKKSKGFKEHSNLSTIFSTINITITDKLLCSFDETDWKYHVRSLIGGNPTLISISGIVKGLDKLRDFYYREFLYKENPNMVDDY